MDCWYKLNSRDEIIEVDEGWQQTAIFSGAENLLAEKVLNRSLWDFITDPTSVYLYREILEKIRAGTNLEFQIRCDTPDHQRLLEVKIRKQENGEILVANQGLRIKPRPRQQLLAPETPGSESVVIICSWCKLVNVAEGHWEEIESAMITLGLFTAENYPCLSHGICNDCYFAILEKIK